MQILNSKPIKVNAVTKIEVIEGYQVLDIVSDYGVHSVLVREKVPEDGEQLKTVSIYVHCVSGGVPVDEDLEYVGSIVLGNQNNHHHILISETAPGDMDTDVTLEDIENRKPSSKKTGKKPVKKTGKKTVKKAVRKKK